MTLSVAHGQAKPTSGSLPKNAGMTTKIDWQK
jgi:hypothetical protein